MTKKYRPRGRPLNKPFEPGPNMKPAYELHDTLKGRPVIVMGQSFSLNYVKLDKLAPFKTISCNRCLRPDSHVKTHPDYYVCVDRDPYAQEVERVKAFKGIRVLSEMLFDPNNMHKKKSLRTHWAPLQPYPDFEWYGFRPVSTSRPSYQGRRVHTRWPDYSRTLSNGILPAFNVDLELLIPGAANVAYSMFQIAAAMGASVIGIVGVDLAWESNKKSHSYGDGNGKASGAFALNPRHTLPFFKAGVQECKRLGIEVYNLSPRGVLSPTVPKISEVEFHKRFAQYAEGGVLYPRELQQSSAVQIARLGRKRHRDNRYKPSAPRDPRRIPAVGGSESIKRGDGQDHIRKTKAADLARSRGKGPEAPEGD